MTEESRAQISVPTRDLGSPEDVRNRVLSVIARLKGHNPFAIAGRAQLRSALGKNVGEVPSVWAYTLESGDEHQIGNEATQGELAVHAALTLWAMHQGSHDTSMHIRSQRGATIGASARRVAVSGASDNRCPEEHPIYRRLCAMISAQTFDALVTHARGLVSVMSSADVQIDYGRLASDFYSWQNPRLRSRVVRQWGRDFARTPLSEDGVAGGNVVDLEPIQSESAIPQD